MMAVSVWLSLIHSLACIPLCIWALIDVDWWTRYSNPDSTNLVDFWFVTTAATDRCIAFSAIYFGWELIHEITQMFTLGRDYANLFHAVMSSTAYCYIGWYRGLGHITLCLALTNELSTPFLNIYRMIPNPKAKIIFTPPVPERPIEEQIKATPISTESLVATTTSYVGGMVQEHGLLNLAMGLYFRPEQTINRVVVKTTNDAIDQVKSMVDQTSNLLSEKAKQSIKVDGSLSSPPLQKEDPEIFKLGQRRQRAHIAFAVAFMVVRIIWQPVILYLRVLPFIIDGWFLTAEIPLTLYTTTILLRPAVIALIELVLSLSLNFCWFYLIVCAGRRALNKTKKT